MAQVLPVAFEWIAGYTLARSNQAKHSNLENPVLVEA
jgi:hypothetical protein